MTINRETIWNDTYQTRTICAGEKTELTITTAIYSPERIVSDLRILINDKFNTASAAADMSADTMELLAAHLIEQAGRVRELESMLAAHHLETNELEAA
jgi:hypothetical protein